MTTSYTIADFLPKDANGTKLGALVGTNLEFVLQKAIAVSATSSKNLGHLAIATHVTASQINTGTPIVAIGGVTGSPVAALGAGQMQIATMDRLGALQTAPRQYTFLASGSVAASANTAHSLFGNYGGLSSLGSWITVHVSLHCSANNLRLYPSNTLAGRGMRIVSGNDYYIDLPPMARNSASTFHFANETAGSNTAVNWMIWY